MNVLGQVCNRKEPRFRICEGQQLTCLTTLDDENVRDGSVVDLSSTGMRVRCEGKTAVGAKFSTELKTDRSHGVYRGIVRRVEPWVGGDTILGCQLDDAIPEDVLEELANLGVVNRRVDDRITWNRPAKMSWELQPGEIDIQIQDYSPGGMRVFSKTSIPDDVRLRIRVETEGAEDVVVAAISAWKEEDKDGCHAGLAFTNRESPQQIYDMHRTDGNPGALTPAPSMRVAFAAFAAAVLLAVAFVKFGRF